MKTVLDIFNEAILALSTAEIDDPEFEATVLMEDLLHISPKERVLEENKVLSDEETSVFFSAVEKRKTHYPLQYIIGSWDFYGRRFSCGKGVLIPRPETELLCEAVISFFKNRSSKRMIDLCSGTGCIGITLALELPTAEVTAVELYDEAFDYLEKNNAKFKNRVKTIKADAVIPFGEFDCVVSNPPYVAPNEMPTLQKEVTFEPETSVLGGDDGLYFYREIAKNWYSHIAENGLLAFEIGDTQSEDVEKIMKELGYRNVSTLKDYSDLDRIVMGVK